MLECMNCGSTNLREVAGVTLMYRCLDCGDHLTADEDPEKKEPPKQRKTRMRNTPWDE